MKIVLKVAERQKSITVPIWALTLKADPAFHAEPALFPNKIFFYYNS